MERAFVIKTLEINPYLKDFYEAACPGCGYKTITTALSSVVVCNGCDMTFAIEIKPTSRNQKITKELKEKEQKLRRHKQ